MSKIKVCTAALLTAVMLLSGCAGTVSDITPLPDGASGKREVTAAVSSLPEETLENHRLIARNSAFSLYVNDEVLSVILVENATGRQMRSAVAELSDQDSPLWRNFIRSGVCIEYYPGKRNSTSRADMYLKNPEKTVTRTQDGFAAHIAYKELGIAFDLFVSLTETGMTAEIPQSSIEETGENKLASVYMYPFMGYSYLDEKEGYMFIPDGCGALISLENNEGKFQQPYSARIYGSDYGVQDQIAAVQLLEDGSTTLREARPVMAPVYGMVHTDEQIGFLAVVEGGQYSAEIYAYPNGALTQYNWVTAKFLYRETYTQPTSKTAGIRVVEETRRSFDARIEFRFVTGEDADYVGLASAYRDYLTEKGRITRREETYRLRLDFFGGDVEKAMIGTRFVPMTTLSDIEDIVEDVRNRGVEKVLAVYKGWQPDGMYGSPPSSLKLEGALGRGRELEETVKNLAGQGVPLYLYGDFLRSYSSVGRASSDYIYRINQQPLKLNTYRTLFTEMYYRNPLAAAELLAQVSDRAGKIGLAGIVVDGLTNQLTSFRQKQGMISRKQAADMTAAALAAAPEGLCLTCSPFDYLWSETGGFLDFPLYGSNYKFVDEEIPFFAMVLKGSLSLHGEYVNFQANSTEYFLKMVESGVFPSFLLAGESPSELIYTDSNSLYSLLYSEYADWIEEYDRVFRELAEHTAGAVVTGHSRQDGVTAVTYSNGYEVYVNYSDRTVTYNGIDVEAHSYWAGVMA